MDRLIPRHGLRRGLVMQQRSCIASLLMGALVALVCTALATAAGTGTSAAATPSYAFVGKGFHMELEVAFPMAYSFYNVSIVLPSDFFFDVAECEQQFRILRVPVDYPVGRRQEAASPPVDVTDAFSKLRVTTDYFFDIEAPVFKVQYTENTAVFLFERLGTAPAAADGVAHSVKGLLVLPIHARYEQVDTDTQFSAHALLFGERVSVSRCLSKVSVRAGGEARVWDHIEATTSGAAGEGHCSIIPVGVLQDISIVYFMLMSLLVMGTLIVALCV
ncbi:hypothetical protein STCU_04606 [Strigomonas culicis]|uniref:Uncharacterized protein n=1 Tax=Strigomonas culicis TaxID=28005 RepID=S9UK83_9TRYP|nr:hypothetical protein STCU_07418 [Strigomonas culicis]EPY29338.1 hypothetical protein STCU_04606 [Strigomonas culicis]|eukprot:EPY23857.1 hypothetical protein STCU_07418 [Strigomonas culicis]